MIRSIRYINRAPASSPGGLLTRQAIPTMEAKALDPFILLNHHGPQVYPAKNGGLPFGPHPHRGFQTLTFVERGSLRHRDSLGGDSSIHAGGVQWMTAGKGIVHAEESTDSFKEEGGEVEVLQLWMNLPASQKMVEATYHGLEAIDIPAIHLKGDAAKLELISGSFEGAHGPVDSISGLFTSRLRLDPGVRVELNPGDGREVLLYLIGGNVVVNGQAMADFSMPVFDNREGRIYLQNTGTKEATLIYAHGVPLSEPVSSYGPFVMNTPEEIEQAISDYQQGRMGYLK